MAPPFGSAGACPDLHRLRRLADDDLPESEGRRLADHVDTCEACGRALAEMRALRTFVALRLGEEDEAASAATQRVFDVVKSGLADARAALPATAAEGRTAAAWWRRGVRRRSRAARNGSRAWWHVVASAAALALVVVAAAAVLGRWSVAASAERVLDEAQVVERAWRYQPGRIRAEVVESAWRDAGGRTRRGLTTLWFNNLVGQEGYTARRTATDGQVEAAWWMRTDGWSAQFVGGEVNRLSLDPPIADVEALLPGLEPEQRDALRYWLSDRQKQVRPQRLVAHLASMLSDAADVDNNQARGRPSLSRLGDFYVLKYPLERRFADGRRIRLQVEETLRVSDLAREYYLERELDAADRIIREVERRAVSRRDATAGEFAERMAEVEGPYPAHWTIVRRTPADILASAIRAWRARPLPPSGEEPTRSPVPPSTE